jgi:ferredoxin
LIQKSIIKALPYTGDSLYLYLVSKKLPTCFRRFSLAYNCLPYLNVLFWSHPHTMIQLNSLHRIATALRPNQRYWLLQLMIVPIIALLGAFWVMDGVHANEFSSSYPNSDYVGTSGVAKHSPVGMAAVAAPAYQIHFSNYEFPTRLFGGAPRDQAMLTQFRKDLYEAVNGFEGLRMTNHLEDADYRVEIECTGVLLCSRLQLNVFDMHRNYLASLQMPRAHLLVSEANLHDEARMIAAAVHKRLMAFPHGGYGTYNEKTGAR